MQHEFKITRAFRRNGVLLAVFLSLFSFTVAADVNSARGVMENQANPLIVISSSEGDIYLELYAQEAPRNVANILALINGGLEIVDPASGQIFSPQYYDGMRFHRVIPGLLIQTGSPRHSVFGDPQQSLADEINARGLALDRMPLILEDGSFNPVLPISNRSDLEELVLVPLYRRMNLESNNNIAANEHDIAARLQALTVMQVYENLGYRYTEQFSTRPFEPGTVALANSGPNTNGPEFFINVSNESQWLNGRYTVIGRVVEGMEVVDQINQTAIDTLGPSTQGTVIYRIRQL